MPIDYKKYPPDWEQRRARILERDGYRCKRCGVPQYAVGARTTGGQFIPIPYNTQQMGLDSITRHWAGLGLVPGGDTRLTFAEAKAIATRANNPREHYLVIVLTVAHLDHDEENWKVADDRLEALCQRCHLLYDIPEKQQRKRAKNGNYAR